ncbi:unnamed protein product [Calypogeia fissa]
MKRLAIWFELPYWKDLFKPHLMDPMHIEANVAKNLLQTIMGIHGKDSRAVQQNFEAFQMHEDAWSAPDDPDLPPAPWILSVEERVIFMDKLSKMIFPTMYGAGFMYSFGAEWPRGLKSHDYHCLIQHGFSTAIRGLLTPLVRQAIYAICDVFKRMGAKMIPTDELDALELDTTVAVSLLEKAFPPSIFVIQTHLVSHMPAEIRMHGPFSPRTMYPWERYMGRLKQHARNRASAEASIAEGHKLRERVFYYNCRVAAHVDNGDHLWHATGLRQNGFIKLGASSQFTFCSERERQQAHNFVLQNTVHLSVWRDEYQRQCDLFTERQCVFRLENWRRRFPIELQEMANFATWLETEVDSGTSAIIPDDFVKAIRSGLSSEVICYKHMNVNGCHFRTKAYDDKCRRTWDCIVIATFVQQSVASTVDTNPVGDTLYYVGYITDILSMTYGHQVEFNMLRVQWFKPVVEEDESKGILNLPHNAVRTRDESGFRVVNTDALVRGNEEPFVMVDQVGQAILVPIQGEGEWCLVLLVESKFSYVADLVDTRAEAGLD